MHTNKFLIGRLIGVHLSSIVKWGYLDNFKPVYFFNKKISHAQKHVTPRSLYACEKLLSLLFSVILFLFCWLIFACDMFLHKQNLFVKKINRLEIVQIASFYNITEWLVIRVGCKINGKNGLEVRESENSLVWLCSL